MLPTGMSQSFTSSAQAVLADAVVNAPLGRDGGLQALFRPRSVAIVGASSDPNKVGGRPLAFLRRGGYPGRIFPVNPGSTEVQGLACVPHLRAIEEPIDQVIVAVAASQVLAVAQDCVDLGVKALQVFSSGFGEGPASAGARQQLSDLARGCGLRVLGPNSLGLFNTADGFFGTFATALDGAWPRSGGIGVATQSGAFGSYFFGMAQRRGLGFSHFVATGSEIDVDVADCVEFLAQDAGTRLIVMAIEGCRDGRKLERALHLARQAGKTVLAMKVGVSSAGARAAATHTGALSGEDRVFDAVLRAAGAHRAQSLQELVDAAYLASIGPLPKGPEVMVITTSGGIGVLAADTAEASGLSLPPVTAQALDDIRRIAPLADGHNPVDTSAGILGDLSAYARMAERALQDRPCHAVLCFMAHIARNPAHWQQLRAPLYELRARHPDKIFLAVLLADAAVTADLEAANFAVFDDPTSAVRALAACQQRRSGEVPLSSQPARASVATFDQVAAVSDGLCLDIHTEADARALLVGWGVPFPASRDVVDEAGLADAAREVGFPVVLKVVSPDLPHKTEVGGVALDLRDEQALLDAAHRMRERISRLKPEARIQAFTVARQVGGGVDVLVGTRIDPVFGPVVTVGAGGVLAEWFGDVAVRPAPVNEQQALEMICQTRVDELLRGWRGASALDRAALAQLVARLSERAYRHQDQVSEMELNPVHVQTSGLWALDALIVPRERSVGLKGDCA